MRELGFAPIEANAAAARPRAFLKAASLQTFINLLVGEPSRVRPNTWTSGTGRWLDRFVRTSEQGLPPDVQIPREWRTTLACKDAKKLVKASVWARSEATAATCTTAMSVYAQSTYASNPLPQHGTGVPSHAVPGLHLMIQLRTRAFPTVRRLARIHVLPERLLEFCPACGGHVSESMEHLLVG